MSKAVTILLKVYNAGVDVLSESSGLEPFDILSIEEAKAAILKDILELLPEQNSAWTLDEIRQAIKSYFGEQA